MRLFEIADALERLFADSTVMDLDTGELTPDGERRLDELAGELSAKALDIAAYLQGERCEAEAIEAQAHRLLERAQRHERRAASLERYLAQHLTPGSQRLSDSRVEIGWRKSQRVEVDEEALASEWWREKVERSPDKKEIAKALKSGETVVGATLVDRWNIQIR